LILRRCTWHQPALVLIAGLSFWRRPGAIDRRRLARGAQAAARHPINNQDFIAIDDINTVFLTTSRDGWPAA
jgi:hypothetical protein